MLDKKEGGKMRRKNYGEFRFRVQKKIIPIVISFLIPYVMLFLYFYGDNVLELFNPFSLFNYIFIGVGVIFVRKVFLKRLFIDIYDKGMIFTTGNETRAIYYEEIDLMSYGIHEWKTLTGGYHSKDYLSFENNKWRWSKRLYLNDLPMGKERMRFLAFVLKKNPNITCDKDVLKMSKKKYLSNEILKLVFMIALSIAATGFALHGILN